MQTSIWSGESMHSVERFSISALRRQAARQTVRCQSRAGGEPTIIGNESVRDIIINDEIKLPFKLQSAFWQLATITVSECCLIKLLPYVLFEKYIYILALEMASSGNRHCASCIGALSFPIRYAYASCRRVSQRKQIYTDARHVLLVVFLFLLEIGCFCAVLQFWGLDLGPDLQNILRLIIRLS